MGKQVFLELTTEKNLKILNIDPRLVDSFKRVMIKIQKYFDSHGYLDKIDFETIINDYLLPQQTVDRELVRQSVEFIKELNDAKENQKQLEAFVSVELEPIEEEKFLDEYVKQKYNIGLSFEVEDKENREMHSGVYKDNLNTIVIKESALMSDRLDQILCHEFIHFLTMCGKDKFGSVNQTMTPVLYEPLTEMLSSDVLGVEPDGYKSYCELMGYLNLLVGVDGYDFFIQRQLDPKYEAVGFVLEDAQDIMDKHKFSQAYGYMDEVELKNLVFNATSQLFFKDYESIEQLTEDMVKIYSAPHLYSNFESLVMLQGGIVDMYLSKNKITNADVKSKIMQLIKLKNDRRLLGNMNCITLNVNDESYVLDDNVNLYLKRLNNLFKLNQFGTLVSYTVADGFLQIYTEAGVYICDLKGVDFKELKSNLAFQQGMLEREIDTLTKETSMNKPYIKSDAISPVIANDTGEKVEILELVQTEQNLRR